MLALPTDWRRKSAGFVITELLEQAEAIASYKRCSSLLFRACMEMLFDNKRWNTGPTPITVQEDRDGFRIRDIVYHNCCRIDDESLATWAKLEKRRRSVIILVPPWSSCVARKCLGPSLKRKVCVLGMDEFANCRVLWTSLELPLAWDETLLRLLRWYSQLNRATGSDMAAIDAVTVNAPSERS
ncbi:MAG: hypothetical protein ABSH20_11645 [Tepidisphaeraceae bacterium]|jgi:hypothetical protein